MAERPVERGRGQVAAEAERDQGQQGGGQPEASRVPSGGYAAPASAAAGPAATCRKPYPSAAAARPSAEPAAQAPA